MARRWRKGAWNKLIYFPSNLLQYSRDPSRNRNGSRIVFSSSSSRRQKNPKCVTTRSAGITSIPLPLAGKTLPIADFHGWEKSIPGSKGKNKALFRHSRCSGINLPFSGKKFCP